MSGIPDDIKKAAEQAIRQSADAAMDIKIEIVGRAILVERMRLVKAMKSNVDLVTKAIVAGKL